MSFTRRGVLLAGGAAAGSAATLALTGARTPRPDLVAAAAAETDILNDASGLSPVRVARHVTIGDHDQAALIERLREELTAARVAGRPLIASAARHSMGAQSLPENGSALTFDQTRIELDRANRRYRVAAGVRWNQVIRRLDTAGWSPTVMQSNNDFGVASTLAVNAHGWPVAHGPFGATVQSIRLMLATGDVVECSRDQNAELFRLTTGGYGLTGIILDLDVAMTPNLMLEPRYERMAPADFAARFVAAAGDPAVEMAYGRLDISPQTFFDEALLITYRPASEPGDLPPASGSGLVSRASRYLFRGQLGSPAVKDLRWTIETRLAPSLYGPATRNSLLNEPVVTLDDRDPARTDILHEYFVAPERFGEFVGLCQRVIPASYQDLFNVTLRYVADDPDSVLAYATGPRIAAVMLFSQEMTRRAEADMARMTRELIDGTIAIGGSYYLPYRPHATRRQFQAAYPRHAEFVAGKLAFDPERRFTSPFWQRYLAEETDA